MECSFVALLVVEDLEVERVVEGALEVSGGVRQAVFDLRQVVEEVGVADLGGGWCGGQGGVLSFGLTELGGDLGEPGA